MCWVLKWHTVAAAGEGGYALEMAAVLRAATAILTAPSIDPAGSGWLRLTPVAGNAKGLALNNSFSFAGNVSVVVEFNYVAWGGNGADGMTLFLYASSTASPMAGAQSGAGLGYCGGAGRTPEALVIRGPASSRLRSPR